MKILPIIVIYKVDWKTCNIYKSLFSKQNIEILIYDNSPQNFNSKYESEITHYIHDASNPGVSKAYNQSAKWAKEHGFSHILVFDDDTLMPTNYINLLYQAIEKYPNIKTFVPILKYNSGQNIFSPTKNSYLNFNRHCISPGLYSLKKYLPVNSGACIELNSFFSVDGYNESIQLDFADYDFFTRLGYKEDTFLVIDCIGEQAFSNEETDSDKLLNRYKFYLQGATEFCNPHIIKIQVIKHTLALLLRTHRVEFLKLYIKYIRNDFSLHSNI